jgi:hypothetical protein
MRLIIASSLFLIFLTGCQQKILYVYQQKVDPKYLASTNVGSPDPRESPKGQMIVAEWWLPKSVFATNPSIRFHILFHNYSEEIEQFPIDTRMGSKTYWVINKKFDQTKGLLAYRVEIITAEGEVLTDWEHQLWVRLINAGADTDLMSSAVSE